MNQLRAFFAKHFGNLINRNLFIDGLYNPDFIAAFVYSGFCKLFVLK
jgi:hypothetical protein